MAHLTRPRRLAIYAHYDARGEIKRYVSTLLEALSPFCDAMHFVSTGALSAGEQQKVAGLCRDVTLRPNVGIDWSMWSHALERIDLTRYDELVLVNSSVFGPLFPLDAMFDRMDHRDCDFWGATDNRFPDWHLQSYFLVFRRAVLDSEAWAAFWPTVLSYQNRFQTIRSYEIGLSQWFVQAGLRGEPYVSQASLFPDYPWDMFFRHKRRDSTCYFPLRLLRRRMPFVKVSLLRDNPCEVDLGPVRRAIMATGYDESLIEFDRPKRQPRSLWERFDDLLHSR